MEFHFGTFILGPDIYCVYCVCVHYLFVCCFFFLKKNGKSNEKTIQLLLFYLSCFSSLISIYIIYFVVFPYELWHDTCFGFNENTKFESYTWHIHANSFFVFVSIFLLFVSVLFCVCLLNCVFVLLFNFLHVALLFTHAGFRSNSNSL